MRCISREYHEVTVSHFNETLIEVGPIKILNTYFVLDAIVNINEIKQPSKLGV